MKYLVLDEGKKKRNKWKDGLKIDEEGKKKKRKNQGKIEEGKERLKGKTCHHSVSPTFSFLFLFISIRSAVQQLLPDNLRSSSWRQA